MKRAFHFLRLFDRYRGGICLSVFLSLIYSIVILSSAEVLNRATAAIESNAADRLPDIVLLAGVATALFVAVEVSSRILRQHNENKCGEHLEGLILDKLFALTKKRRMQTGSGEFAAKIGDHAAKAVNGTLSLVMRLFEGIFIVLIGGAYMFWMNPILAACFVAFNILFRVVTRALDKKIRAAAKRGVSIKDRNTAFTTELIENSVMIRVFQCFSFFSNRYAAYELDEQKNDVRAYALDNGYDEIQWFTKKIAEFLIPFGLGGVLIAMGYMTFSVAIAFTIASDIFAKGCNNLLWAVMIANSTGARIDAVTTFLDDPETDAERPAPDSGAAYAIRFDNVSFSYDDRPLIRNASFDVPPGALVQITGPNGHGKSTLLQLIAGYLAPDKGSIRFGPGCERCGVIPQFPQIVGGDAYENLSFSENPDTKTCDPILEGLKLSAVRNNPPASFSQGEKQRLMIGRALYHLPECALVLGDEIFANIDPENRAHIASLLQEQLKGKTVFMVCHEDMGIVFDMTMRVENGTITLKKGACAI